jgi:hypothetical protein
MKKNTWINHTALLISLATCITGCMIAPAPYHYQPKVIYRDAVPPPVITHTAPPTPQIEVIGTPPVQGYFWIPGVWLWEDERYVWHAGYWEAPKPGYVWIPHQWRQVNNEWHGEGGYWQHQ